MRNVRITKYTSLFLVVIIVLALPAFLPDAVQAQDNSVNLELGGEGASSWDIGGIMPGDSGTKTVTLHNAGNVGGFVIIWISDDVVSAEGANPESETGDTSEPGELQDYLLFNISCNRLQTNTNLLSLPTTIYGLPASHDSPGYIWVTPLNKGDTVTLDWLWKLPFETGNDIQGDSLSFTINYSLEGLPPPTVGGWGIAPPTSPPPGTTDVSGIVTTAGRFTSTVSITSEDSRTTLTIPEGTVGLTQALEPLNQISIVEMTEPPAPPAEANFISLAYDFGPEGATFDPPITVTFSYDPTKIPAGVNEEDLVLAFYNKATGQWETLSDIVVDPVTHTISGKTSHFTLFVILTIVTPASAPVPVPTPIPAPKPTSTPVPAPAPTPTPTPPEPVVTAPVIAPVAPTNWWLTGGLIAAVIVIIGLLVYFLWWRRRSARPRGIPH